MNYPSSSVLRLLLLLLPILQAAALAGREGDAADARFVAWSWAHNKTYPNRAAAAKAEANFWPPMTSSHDTTGQMRLSCWGTTPTRI